MYENFGIPSTSHLAIERKKLREKQNLEAFAIIKVTACASRCNRQTPIIESRVSKKAPIMNTGTRH
jgi:hypothetical protein